ncbi:MAG: ATP-dependent DNA helicase RecG [Eubacteriales bacterium]|nr:ATP-dependent DNA helicase RecG [Eubacteriales bacterium]
MLDIPLTSIKGIGPKRAELFSQLGVCSVGDLLFRLPRDYLDYTKATPITQLVNGQNAAVQVRISGATRFFRTKGMTMLSAPAQDETGKITLKWFNQPYRSSQLKIGEIVYACGRVIKKNGASLINPSFSQALPGIVPVYPTVKGVNQRAWRDSIYACLESVWDKIPEPLPRTLLERYNLVPLALALRHAHFPFSREALELARRRLDFENTLLYFIIVELQKAERLRQNGFSFDTSGVLERFTSQLSFSLTRAQLRVLDEIGIDMRKPVPMNRLLQGDVGSGKTAVAMYALCVAAANGKQGALLAPTEILAEQHAQNFGEIFGETVVLLKGSMKKKQREEALEKIANGSALFVIGTHALLSQDVRFYDLGCIVTDEQHRFGVRQRAAMLEKGVRPDMLVMSATPIPRTLALILYGDLDISVIDELPPGRKPVKTSVIPASKREDMYAYIASQAKEGVQSYVVCPAIEESDTIECPSVNALYTELKKMQPETRFAKLHGQMKEAEKERVMHAFRAGEIDVLVTTTVIEVGVHVPNACIMAIEGAERFGLSQLHQLRGRVGRSAKQAYCFLLYGVENQQDNERMLTMTQTNDGFEIAQKDLLLRGPGDFIGTRQHGDDGASLLSGAMDAKLLEQASKAARDLLNHSGEESARLIELASERYGTMLNDIAMN